MCRTFWIVWALLFEASVQMDCPREHSQPGQTMCRTFRIVWALLIQAPVQIDCPKAFTARSDNVQNFLDGPDTYVEGRLLLRWTALKPSLPGQTMCRTFWMVWALLFQAPVQIDCPRAFTARRVKVLPVKNVLDGLGTSFQAPLYINIWTALEPSQPGQIMCRTFWMVWALLFQAPVQMDFPRAEK
jgi:hypothetical protein